MQEMRTNKKDLFLRTMGISNVCYDSVNKKYHSVQFYDYDGKDMTYAELKRILEIFPYDCIFYETKHGLHFISFSLLKGKNITKARALKTTKELEHQDYWCSLKDLTLRVAPKWKVSKFKKKYKVINPKPKFKGMLREPNGFRISLRHLEFYKKYMNLPRWVIDLYEQCTPFDFNIKIYHYKTRD